MSNVITNLRVRFGADTKQFKQGADEADKALTGFTRSGTSVMDRFARMFGVNISGITSSLEEMNDGIGGISRGLSASARSSGLLTAALKALKVAMVATGIGALVVALGSLAAYFTRNQEGADKLSRAMASIGAVFDIIIDTAAKLGRALTKVFTEPKETVRGLWEFIQRQFVNRITALPRLIESAWNIVKGIFTGGSREAAAEFQDAMLQVTTGMDAAERSKAAETVRKLGREMWDASSAANDLKRAEQELRDEEIRLIEVNQARRAEVAKLRLTARDEEKSIRERAEAQKQAMEITRAEYADEIRIQKERARILEEQMELSDNMAEDNRELAETKARLNELDAQMNDRLRRLSREYNTLNRELADYLLYQEQLTAERERSAAAGFDMASPIGVTALALPQIDLAPMRALKTMNEEVSQSFIDLSLVINGAMQDAATGLAAGLGEMLGTGEGFRGFGQMVGGIFADMAINVGRIAMATGIAVSGIKKALSSLNPALAIAAGAALVAIGTAAKSALSAAATGGGGTGAISRPMAFDSTGDTSAEPGQRRVDPITIIVEGELRARGNDLVTVFDRENSRKRMTT